MVVLKMSKRIRDVCFPVGQLLFVIVCIVQNDAEKCIIFCTLLFRAVPAPPAGIQKYGHET